MIGRPKEPEDAICAAWNQHWPSGSEVDLVNDLGETTRTKTRSEAWQLGHGAVVVMVEGRTGGYDLARIIPIRPPGYAPPAVPANGSEGLHA